MKHVAVLGTFVAVGALAAIYSVRLQARADDKSEITAVEQRIVDGFNSKDVNKVMSAYAPDVFVFDVIPPREYVGAKAYRKDWEELFAQYPGPGEAEIRHLTVTADGSFGYAHLIFHSVLIDKDGKKLEADVRTTDVLHKSGGAWLIVHEHNSVPVDFATGKADFMSKP